ncbi:hypothetical protein NLG97_g6835 [Lecanicillium saksenae]|uniref:Uncharacterized protein n=1 Tax=Lecanicillium saksenae TaxID=468837 RepID=A0ACC1QP23_9HYPO|nr:hypothetical protein NLG97_g6835 [Lecanicillium saksenae]
MRPTRSSLYAFMAPTLVVVFDILHADAIKPVIDRATLSFLAICLAWGLNPLEEARKAGICLLTSLAIHYFCRHPYQAVWSRLRPDSPSETILPLYEDRAPPIGIRLEFQKTTYTAKLLAHFLANESAVLHYAGRELGCHPPLGSQRALLERAVNCVQKKKAIAF